MTKLKPFVPSSAILVPLAFAFLSEGASACSVCMGDPASKTAGALNNAIFVMLGFIGVMLSGVGAFIYNLAQRSKAPIPPHQELAQDINHDSTID